MVREILIWPHPVLQTPAKPIRKIGAQARKLVEDMFQTLYASENGIGLAAPQIGVGKRVVVIDLSRGEDPAQRLVLINPVIVRAEGECPSEEACLSVPGEFGEVMRAEKVRVEALDLAGQPFAIQAAEFPAIVLQHEIDHLDGVVYVERMAARSRAAIRRRMKKLQAEREKAKAKKRPARAAKPRVKAAPAKRPARAKAASAKRPARAKAAPGRMKPATSRTGR